MPARKAFELSHMHRVLDEARFSLSAEFEMKIREMAKTAVENNCAYAGGVNFPVARPPAGGGPGYDTIRVQLTPEFMSYPSEALLMAEAQIREQW